MASQLYEVFALRYAHFADRTQGNLLMFPDDHAAPMPLDFFIWVIRVGGRTIVLDTASTKLARTGGVAPGCARRSLGLRASMSIHAR